MSFGNPLSKGVDPWSDITNVLEGIDHCRSVGELRRRSMKVFKNVGRLVDELIVAGSFEEDWPHIRCFVPLQIRLCAEQILYERGGGWRRYISGFKPLDVYGSRASGGSVEEDRLAIIREHNRMVELGKIRPDAPVDFAGIKKKLIFAKKLAKR